MWVGLVAGGLLKYQDGIYPRTVTHLSTNPARRGVTSLMCPTTLPPSHTAERIKLPAIWMDDIGVTHRLDLLRGVMITCDGRG